MQSKLKLNKMSKVKIGTIQMSCVADKQQNLEKAIKNIESILNYGNKSEVNTILLKEIKANIEEIRKSSES